MSSETLSLPRTQWVISRNQDLFFFIGSSLIGLSLLTVAALNGGLPARFLVAFVFAIDGPHVFSTLTRALLDRGERRNLGLTWIAYPACVLLIWSLSQVLGGNGAFIVIASLSHYHISKQHMGFVMIYKRKGREITDFKIDRYFTLISLILPFLFYLSAVFTHGTSLLWVFLAPSVLLICLYVHYQTRKERVNVPKILLLAGFIPLQWAAWSFAALDPGSMTRLVAVGVATNVGHSLQYLRLMYFHNSNRYSKQTGLLGVVSRSWVYFMAAVVILALPNHIGIQTGNAYLKNMATGFLFFHFILDSKLWRVRGNPDLAKALGLG